MKLQLVIGNFGLSYDQSKAHMAIWCILAAPLFISADLANMKPDMKNILVNAIAISIDQDPMGIPGRRIYKVPIVTVRSLINIFTIN